MRETLKKLLTNLLRETADKIDAGTCELTNSEAEDMIATVLHIALSKEEACRYLNCSRATFDNAIRDGLIPKGRKQLGRTNLVWYKDELSKVLKR